MNNKKSSNVLIFLLSIGAVAGGGLLIVMPTLISGTGQIIAWVMVGVSAITAGAIKHINTNREKLEAEKALEKQRLRRSQKRKEEQQRREEKIEALKEKLVKKEEKKAEKLDIIKSDLVKQAGTVWAGRIEHAEAEENKVRQIIEIEKDMDVRNAAGQVALLWHETSAMAQWTAKQIIMFSQRPNVTTKAREEAQEAIIEAAEIRESGGNWTKEKGEELARLKEKAKEEAKVEDKRLDQIKDVIENAEIKWRASEVQIRRWQEELDTAIKKSGGRRGT